MQIMNGMGKGSREGRDRTEWLQFKLQASSTPLVMLCCFVVLTMTTVSVAPSSFRIILGDRAKWEMTEEEGEERKSRGGMKRVQK